MTKERKRKIEEIQNRVLCENLFSKKEFKKVLKTFKNKEWKHDWLPIITMDKDSSGSFLFNLIVYKLEKMKLFFESINCKNRTEILKSLNLTLSYGWRLLEDDYYSKSDDFWEAHMVTDVRLTDEESDNANILYEYSCYPLFDEETQSFKASVNLNTALDFIEEEGLEYGKTAYIYTRQRWDDAENEAEYANMYKEEENNRKRDYIEFFSCLCNYMGSWEVSQ